VRKALFLAISCIVSAPFFCFATEEDARDQLKTDELPTYENLRDPFWPLGYTRHVEPKVDSTRPDEPEQPVKVEPKWPKLKVKAITSSPKGYIAILEGIGLVEEGQTVKMTVDGVVYSWQIDKISKKGFSYKQLGAEAVK